MLRANVGLSRKVSKDYNSTGFSVNLDGEVLVGLDDPNGVIERIKELYDVAEEALAQQIERYNGESAIASRDATQNPPANGGRTPSASPRQSSPAPSPGAPENGSQPNGNGQTGNGNGHTGNANAATNKQIQFLLNLGKRQGLTAQRLEARIAEILGRKVGIYQLTKQEAGQLIDALNGTATANGSGSGRGGR